MPLIDEAGGDARATWTLESLKTENVAYTLDCLMSWGASTINTGAINLLVEHRVLNPGDDAATKVWSAQTLILNAPGNSVNVQQQSVTLSVPASTKSSNLQLRLVRKKADPGTYPDIFLLLGIRYKAQ